MSELLDNPVWHALGGPHRGLGTELHGLRRYRAEISVFGAVEHPADLSPLAHLPAGESVGLATTTTPRVPATFETILAGDGVQMVADRLRLVPERPDMVSLGDADVEEMMELVALTRPGPFNRRTYQMDRYIGVRDGGRLIAMAGERMHLPGFTEVSAVCTHPDYRGRSYAKMLVSEIAQGIIGRGETPFLHTFADNAVAIATYEKLGFVLRSRIRFTVMRRLTQ